MTHPTPEVLQSYRRLTLASKELLDVDDHIAGCEECRRVVASGVTAGEASQRMWSAVRGEHVSYEQIEQYVQGRLPADERAMVAAHAKVCPTCAGEIDDLDDYVHAGRRWSGWAVAAAAAAVVIAMSMFWMRDASVPTRDGGRPTVKANVPPSDTKPAPTDSVPVVEPDPLQNLSPQLQRVAKFLQAGVLPSAALLSSLQPPAEHQRSYESGEETGIRLLDPAGIVVEDGLPTFRWERVDRREEVTVQVYDRRYAVVAESPRLRGTSWRVPVSLTRGETYRWQLRVHLPDGRSETVPAAPAPPALFHVLGSAAFEELRAARRSGSMLEIGLISMREGLVAEGSQALSQYAAEHPRSPEAARLAEQAALIAKSQRARTATSSTDG